MNSLNNNPMNESGKFLDSQLWHACAGGMVQMPPVNSKVFYFPQGHAEHAQNPVDFGNFPRIPPYILCGVSSIKFLADTVTDEVYAKMGLVPLRNADCDFDDDGLSAFDKIENQEKPNSFAKTLTQSDANNGGGFSVPRYCAETIFPRLDYSAEPPVQTILVKDVHGEIWKFRHIYRGTPRRHLLTTGWSNFVNQKKLVAGDSIVFLRADNGDLCVGIRRVKRGLGSGHELPSGWNTGVGNSSPLFQVFSVILNESKFMPNGTDGNSDKDFRGRGKVRAESVLEAATLAVNGKPFEVIYSPRASTPEFCVKASAVRAAMSTQWYSGMRFKMPFETEDSSRISWFMGTISSVQLADPIRWPNSPWRLLQVAWDEPDLLQNVKCVSPWLVELVSNIPAIPSSPFSPPRKKLRLPHPLEFPLAGQFTTSPFHSNPLMFNNPLCCISENIPAGIQGARHAQIGLSSPGIQFNKLNPSLFQFGLQQLEHTNPPSRIPSGNFSDSPENDENISCLLTVGNSSTNLKKRNDTQSPAFILFGQPILTEQQISQSYSGDTVGNNSMDENSEKMENLSDGSGSLGIHNVLIDSSSDEGFHWYRDPKAEFGLETGQCKVFLESDNVGRTLDLRNLHSYEELNTKLADVFGIDRLLMLGNVLCQDAKGTVMNTGDEPFSEFLKTAKRLTILMDSGSECPRGVKRK